MNMLQASVRSEKSVRSRVRGRHGYRWELASSGSKALFGRAAGLRVWVAGGHADDRRGTTAVGLREERRQRVTCKLSIGCALQR